MSAPNKEYDFVQRQASLCVASSEAEQNLRESTGDNMISCSQLSNARRLLSMFQLISMLSYLSAVAKYGHFRKLYAAIEFSMANYHSYLSKIPVIFQLAAALGQSSLGHSLACVPLEPRPVLMGFELVKTFQHYCLPAATCKWAKVNRNLKAKRPVQQYCLGWRILCVIPTPIAFLFASPLYIREALIPQIAGGTFL